MKHAFSIIHIEKYKSVFSLLYFFNALAWFWVNFSCPKYNTSSSQCHGDAVFFVAIMTSIWIGSGSFFLSWYYYIGTKNFVSNIFSFPFINYLYFWQTNKQKITLFAFVILTKMWHFNNNFIACVQDSIWSKNMIFWSNKSIISSIETILKY